VQRLLDAGVRLALSHLAEDILLARSEGGEWGPRGAGAPGDQVLDDDGVDDRPAAGDLAQGADEVLQVSEPVLGQIGGAGGAVP
jgi:hypothetical protein